MSRKHFQALADCLKTLPTANGERYRAALAVAEACKASNSRFDRERFFRAAEASPPERDHNPQPAATRRKASKAS
jgi:hypothetical protein